MQNINAQDTKLPYAEIPDYPENTSASGVLARLIDGLGFRYYWATEGLRKEDLAYKPSKDARNAEETLNHIYSLSSTILKTFQEKAISGADDLDKLSFEEKRKITLENLKKASKILKTNPQKDISDYKITFQRGDRKSEFPIWNLINGQISDAIYHVGQIVSFRRASGNPMNPNVNVFLGKVRK